MGLVQDAVIKQMGEQMQGQMQEMLEKANKMNEETVSILKQVLEVMKEIQLCTNNNFLWTMNTLQSLCDQQGMKLTDPMESNNG